MQGILTITLNPALDVTTAVTELVPHVKMRCDRPLREPGGGGINVSRMIAVMGGESTAFLALNGAVGEDYRNLVTHAGLDARIYEAPDETRETVQVVDRSSGEQYRFVMPGPFWEASAAADLLGAIEREMISGGYGWVVASGSLPPGLPDDFYARIALIAQTHDIRFVLDTSGKALREGIKAPLSLVKPDCAEISELAGGVGCKDEMLESVAHDLVLKSEIDALIYTRGEEGAVLVTPEGCKAWRPPYVKVESLTGAGDAFLALVVLSLANDETLASATCWGVAAAAATALAKGTAMGSRNDVIRLRDEVVRVS